MSRSGVNILIYHRVLDGPDPMRPGEVDVQQFNKQMRWIKRFYNVLDLSEALDRQKNNTLPPRALSITFDDGYRDNFTNALPILQSHQLKATFFIATGFLNGGIMWNDVIIESIRRTKANIFDLTNYGLEKYDISEKDIKVLHKILADIKYLSIEVRTQLIRNVPELLNVNLPTDLMMSSGEVNSMFNQGMAIGGHTVNHPILSTLKASDAKSEITAGKVFLEELIGAPVDLFAYPNGGPDQDYTQEHINIVDGLGFKAAVSTAWGVATSESDSFQLPRFTPWDQNIYRFLLRLWMMQFSEKEKVVTFNSL